MNNFISLKKLIFNSAINLISIYTNIKNIFNKYKFNHIVFDEKMKIIKNQNILQRYLLHTNLTDIYYINSIKSRNQIYYSIDKILNEEINNDIIEDLDEYDYNDIIDKIEYVKINFNSIKYSILIDKPDFFSQFKNPNTSFYYLLKKTTANTKFKHMIYYYLYNNLKISDVIDNIEIHTNDGSVIDKDYNIKEILDKINN